MSTEAYSLSSLFSQLGLDASDEAIDAFIRTHQPIPADLPLYKASCWNSAQATFLRESIAHDSDWTEIVDTLDSLLRK